MGPNNYADYITLLYPITVDRQSVYWFTNIQGASPLIDPYYVWAACSNFGILSNTHLFAFYDFSSCDNIWFNNRYPNPGLWRLYPYDIMSSPNLSLSQKLDYLLDRYPYRSLRMDADILPLDNTLWDNYAVYIFPVFNMADDTFKYKYHSIAYDEYVSIISNPTNYLSWNRYDISNWEYIWLWYAEPSAKFDFYSNSQGVAISQVFMSWYSTWSVSFKFKVKDDVIPGTSITNIWNIATNTHGYDALWTFCKNPYQTWYVPWGNNSRLYDRYIYGSCADNSPTILLAYNNIRFTWETIPWPNNTWSATVIVTWTMPINLSVSNTSSWSTFDPWDNVTYNISYCNQGIATQSWVVVQYNYPIWLTYLTSNIQLLNHSIYQKKDTISNT